MERHKEADLSILHPLANAISRASLHACDEGAIIDDAVEDLPDWLGGWVHMRLSAMLGRRALARTAAHLAGGARCLWAERIVRLLLLRML